MRLRIVSSDGILSTRVPYNAGNFLTSWTRAYSLEIGATFGCVRNRSWPVVKVISQHLPCVTQENCAEIRTQDLPKTNHSIEVRLSVCLFATTPRPALGYPSTRVRVKRPERELNNAPPSNTDVKNAWSLSYTPSVWVGTWIQAFYLTVL